MLMLSWIWHLVRHLSYCLTHKKCSPAVIWRTVDFGSAAIVELGSNPNNIGKNFHLFNLDSAPRIHEIAEAAKSLGWLIEKTPYESWRTMVTEREDIALAPLKSYFRTRLSQIPDFGISEARAALGELKCPPVTKDVLCAYYKYIVEQGYLSGVQQAVTNDKK